MHNPDEDHQCETKKKQNKKDKQVKDDNSAKSEA